MKLFLGAFNFLFIAKLVICESCGPIDILEVNFLLINASASNRIPINIGDTQILWGLPEFKLDRPTVIYAFDFLENHESISAQIIIDAYLQSDDHNILILDYGKFSGGNYIFDAVPNAIKIGKLIGAALVNLSLDGFDLGSLHLIGFSLGAHLMSEVGRTVKEVSGGKMVIERITGLDPASPAFFPLNPYITALSRNDASFVDIIHTDGTKFGTAIATGTVDFYPNGGKDQPGCPPFDDTNILNRNNFCSHLRSVEYFAESVRSRSSLSFPGLLCGSWKSFANLHCLGFKYKPTNQMGMNANRNQPGNFFLQTNSKPEYSLGERGLVYADEAYEPRLVTPFLFVN